MLSHYELIAGEKRLSINHKCSVRTPQNGPSDKEITRGGVAFQSHGFVFVLPDATSTEQQELFTQKLQQCCVIFDFLDSVTDLKSKEIKRATLNELVDYVSTNRGVLVESAYPEITDMVSTLVVLFQ